MPSRASATADAIVQEGPTFGTMTLGVAGWHYREVNAALRDAVLAGATDITLHGVNGQRYLGTNLQRPVRIRIVGVPGQDLGAFMDGPHIEVLGSAQDGCGNTMNSGCLVIHGSTGDIVGLSMRGGRIFVRDDAGYRVAIHMKEYEDTRPVIAIGGTAQHFLGEYMARGVLIVLGSELQPDQPHPSRFVGTGMHGGAIHMRGHVNDAFLGKEVGMVEMSAEDEWLVRRHVEEFAGHFGADVHRLLSRPFTKLVPLTKRPYGRLYAY